MSIVLRFIRARLRVQLERPLAFDCMSSVPSPAGYSTTRADKEFEGLSTDIEHQHNDHPSSWYNRMYKHLLSRDPICAARSTCVICYFTRHVQQLYCYKLLTFTFVAAGSMAASRTACELRLSCTLALVALSCSCSDRGSWPLRSVLVFPYGS